MADPLANRSHTAIIMPMQYRQGPGTIRELPHAVSGFGEAAEALVIATSGGWKRLGGIVEKWRADGLRSKLAEFGGECSEAEIERLKREAEISRADVVVGIGGGKLLDAAKSVAFRLCLPIVIVPTIASSDAPCSALSVIYDEEGRVAKFETHPRNPDLVLVDTELILQAPLRYLAAGMGDALATAPEALANLRAGGRTILGASPTRLGTAVAELCGRILDEDGAQAYDDAARGIRSEAFERVVEANTLLSGIGFESGGLAAAHSLHDGLTELPDCHHLLHGEKVGFCTAVQATLLGNPFEAAKHLRFCRRIGLPASLAETGLIGDPSELRVKLLVAGRRTLDPGESIHELGRALTASEIADAFEETDRIAKELFG
ncbi:glycerol dehydrogenase [Cohnella sp. AR92]|uniref:glycerol dehydrogenase n=1 Tax=Cohnella sp. AR92 TaxID=648716 RepID=UPI000F8DEBD8|nr:glycerol dehydrogenase [Cohnella sp. AR92]RUS46196.1 glycerol dehydrogenase [Cohnella sp. AR92]